MKTSQDMGLMNRLAAYVREKGDCSMGEVEIELSVKAWKQYWLHRTFGDFFPDVDLRRGRWFLKPIAENTQVPLVTQDVLSTKR